MGDARKAEGRVSPAPTESPAAKLDARSHLSAVATIHVAGQVIPGGFWTKVASGKVRPAPRERATTHYGCDCCRWSA
jgi:hypothetical protein